jgi:O-antigen/teichoic acid export membrane protein
MTFARQSASSLAALVFGIVASILLARLLGAEGRGEYALAVKVAGLVLAVAQWGVPEVVLQLLAERRRAPGTLVGTSLTLGVAGALVVAAALAVAFPRLGDSLLRGVDPLLLGLALAGSVASLVGLLARRFIQLGGRVHLYNALDVARTALFLALVAVAAGVFSAQAPGATLAWLLAELALALVSLGLVRPRPDDPWRVSPSLARELVRSGAPIQVGLLAMFIGSEGGAYVLNARLDLAAVGVYTVALSVARLVLQISLALRTVLQPRLVGPTVDAAAVTARVTRHGLLWMALLALAIGVGAPLMPVIFSREFAASAPVLVLMLPGMVAYGFWQLLASHLLRIGRRGVLAAVAWAFALASIVLQAFGAQALGPVGAAAGLSLAYLVGAGLVAFVFVRLTGRSPRDLVPGAGELAFYVDLARAGVRSVSRGYAG